MKIWEQDERERMELEHERSLGSSHIEDRGGAVRQMEMNDQEELETECERPSWSSHIVVGGGVVLNLDH
jgi:hypothetical protein